MKEDFTDRLLDSALRNYSSVDVPEGFAERLAAAKQIRRDGRKWWWLLVPAAAALAIALMMRPAAESPRPVVAVRRQPPSPILQPPAPARRVAAHRAKPKWRTLTAVEIASADFPLEILRPLEVKPLKDLEVPALEIKPLAGADQAAEETVPKEPQL